jgi:erythrocyte band 7 integral membrane protein
MKVINQYERAVVFRLGKLLHRNYKAKGPGLFFILPCIDNMLIIDLRTMIFDVPPQEILT